MDFPQCKPIVCTVTYATAGGPTGKGILFIEPQNGVINSSDEATAFINFLGGLTPDQATNDGQAGGDVNPGVPTRYVITSAAATSLRIDLDFAAGTSTIYASTTVNLADDEMTNFPQKVVTVQIGPKAFYIHS